MRNIAVAMLGKHNLASGMVTQQLYRVIVKKREMNRVKHGAQCSPHSEPFSLPLSLLSLCDSGEQMIRTRVGSDDGP